MSNKVMSERDVEAVTDRLNGHQNGPSSNKTMVESDLEALKEWITGQENGQIGLELLKQFQQHGVTVPHPTNFADAISPQRGQNDKDKAPPPVRANGHIH